MVEKLLVILMLVAAIWLFATDHKKPQGIYIDCSLASFHPDYTQEHRELCRKLGQKQSEPRKESQ